MSTSLSHRVASTLADLDMQTAQLVIELALDGRYQLPDDGFDQNRVLSNLEYALAEQEWEFMGYRSVYELPQSTPVAATGSLSDVGVTGNLRTDRGGNGSEGPSHGLACPSDLFDDLPSIRSETDTLSDNEGEDDPHPCDAYSIAGASEPYDDDLPSIRSETPELPHDIASDSRPSSAYYLEKQKSLEYLPSIRSESFSRDEDDDDPLSDDGYTIAADGSGCYEDLPSICSETSALSEDDYSLVGTTISPESLVEYVHDADVPTGTGMMHALHRCSKALLSAIDGIGCIRWRRIKHGILGSICAPQTQGSLELPQ